MEEIRRKAIVFILYTALGQEQRVVGTGFVYGEENSPQDDSWWLYAITAGHVVARAGDYSIRLRRADGTGRDVRIDPDDVFLHPTADVAALAFSLGGPSPERDALDIAGADRNALIHLSPHEPSVGDEVTISGLFGLVPEMHSSVVPMTRGGVLGSPLLTSIPMRYPDGSSTSQSGYLIDCQSIPGFSGAPCFVKVWFQPDERTPRLGLSLPPRPLTYLLGVVGGHFDDTARVSVGEEQIGIPRPTGVAVVYPSTTITELMELPEVRDERR